ncbi:MAG TPA: hypothetical protein PK370_03525 [Candidatus Woesebacteria bacterium]|nr:hypothetical protein [Candidatus Woesebacteria bacterium]HPJ16730.1 hypothetical protein [Candidatus Woesebacteria bacterium]
MRIQLFDRGLPQGKKLFENLDAVCQRMQLDCAPEYLKDMNRVYAMGYQGDTILLINGEVALIDKYPSQKELENLIVDFQK